MKGFLLKLLWVVVTISVTTIAQVEDSNLVSLESLLEVKIDSIEYVESASKYSLSPDEVPSSLTIINSKEKGGKIVTFTGVSSFISDNDVSVGFELENNKLQITIKLESAKVEVANFSSRLLSVSQIK